MISQDKLWLVSHFKNYRQIVNAYSSGALLPPLELRNGLIIHDATNDHINPDKAKSFLHLFKNIFVYELYTKDSFYIPQTNHTIIDIGSDVGLSALHCYSKCQTITVHCFEPSAQKIHYLTKNIEVNQLEEHFSIHPVAVLDQETKKGIIEFSTGLSFFETYKNSEVVPIDIQRIGFSANVECISLTQALKIAQVPKVDFLKIHAEGAEVEIVAGASQADFDKVDKVAIISHDFIKPNCTEFIVHKLTEFGFLHIVIEPEPDVKQTFVIRASRSEFPCK